MERTRGSEIFTPVMKKKINPREALASPRRLNWPGSTSSGKRRHIRKDYTIKVKIGKKKWKSQEEKEKAAYYFNPPVVGGTTGRN